MKPAARVGDNHECKVHGAGPVSPPCSINVLTNNFPQARATDQLACPGTPPLVDFIVTGSGTVLVNKLPAARQTDKTMHPPPGSIMVGSPNVLIGGPTVGATLGNPGSGDAACFTAATGRKSQDTFQSASNCGVEAARQIINQTPGVNVSENALLDHAINNGFADNAPLWPDRGGARPSQLEALLTDRGVHSSRQPQTMGNIIQAVAEGRGVITSNDVALLWGPPNTGGHAVLVTGIEFDANGNPQTVIVNDTAKHADGINCGRSYPAATFKNSFLPGNRIVVTNNPIW